MSLTPPTSAMTKREILKLWPSIVPPQKNAPQDFGRLRLTRLPYTSWRDSQAGGRRQWEVEVFLDPLQLPSGELFAVETATGVEVYQTLKGKFYRYSDTKECSALFRDKGYVRCWVVTADEARSLT